MEVCSRLWMRKLMKSGQDAEEKKENDHRDDIIYKNWLMNVQCQICILGYVDELRVEEVLVFIKASHSEELASKREKTERSAPKPGAIDLSHGSNSLMQESTRMLSLCSLLIDGVEELDNNLILSSVKEAKKLVDTAYKRTRDVLKERLQKRTMTPSDVMTYFKQPVATSRTHIRAADYIETTLDLLTEKVQSVYSRPFNISDLLTANQIDMLHKVSGYAFLHLPKNCQPSRYRTFTGECNNRRFPNFGVSNRPYARLLPAQYEDGRGLPKGWTEDRRINGFPLPLARAVSNQIIRFPEREQTLDKQRSLMFMQWGQWIDHDLDLAPETPSRSTFIRGIDCDHSCARELPCYPLRIPPNDPRISNRSDCIPLFRSSPAFQQGSPIREQMNILTSYVDASQVYGSTNKLARMLRNNDNQLGLMAVNNNFSDNGRPYLPFSTNGIEEDFCQQTNKSSGLPCFLAGDGRVSEQPGLTAFHTLFVREHNRIAGVLRRMNPRWSGETLFQETRKIIGAISQKINYKDWLPLLLGSSMSRVLPQYRNYNESVNPGASNVFSLVFRMGHTMIQPFIYRLVDNYKTSQRLPPVPLHLTFFNTWRVHGNQGKHRVTKRGPALSYPMFTLVTGIVGRWRAVCVTALQRPNSDAAAIRIVVGIAAASLNDGNQGKQRVTKRGPALSYPMFTLVTGIVGRWRAVCVTALQRPNSDAAAIRIVVGGIDPLLRGLMANQAKLNRQNQILVDELREHLFELFKRLGLDLGAINLQRGRDHGLPGYNAWRRFCGLSEPSNVAELAQVLRNRPLAEQFMSLYGTPRNIDIWIGAVAEPLLPNARVGELLACLIGNQFRRTRDGDRFYYERPTEFTIAQKRAIDRATMSRMICDNTAISQVPRNVFLANTFPGNFVSCSQIPILDLSPWRRRKSGSGRSHTTARYGRVSQVKNKLWHQHSGAERAAPLLLCGCTIRSGVPVLELGFNLRDSAVSRCV
ncbi:unnamed protein product [Ranitomeya imitator]|uniref:Eosinophil peroxidase n=1 Tax=Ranitomeya imitator TaxID=111125 RepID=A0ABN9KZX7_9NEOB|nr:unnamed protein product [Ranitomeya imitator]